MPDYSTIRSPLLSALQKYREKYFAEALAAATDEAQKQVDEALALAEPEVIGDCDANSDAQRQTVATTD